MNRYSSNRKTSHVELPILTQRDRFDRMIFLFQRTINKLQETIENQNNKIKNIQTKLNDNLGEKLDKLIMVNENINEGIQKLVKYKKKNQKIEKTNNNLIIPDNEIQNVNKNLQSPQKKLNNKINNQVSNLNQASKQIQENLNEKSDAGNVIAEIKNLNIQFLKKTQNLDQFFLNKNNSKYIYRMFLEVYTSIDISFAKNIISKWAGHLFTNLAHRCYEQYSSNKIGYSQMKIKFSYKIFSDITDIFCIIMEAFKYSDINFMSKRHLFLQIFNQQSKYILQYLQQKYPPNKQKKIDNSLTYKIKEVKDHLEIKYDMLYNSELFINKKIDFSREIKLLINKLIIQINMQFSEFKKTMRSIFQKKILSSSSTSLLQDIEYQQQDNVTFLIGRKIPQETQIYSEQQLDYPGLSIKSPEIMRILIKWIEQLMPVFTNPKQKIINNVHGFKSIKKGFSMNLTKKRKQKLAQIILQIFEKQIKQKKENRTKELNSSLLDIFWLVLDGAKNYEFITDKQLKIIKISQYFSEKTESLILQILNKLLYSMSLIRQKFEDSQIESHIHLITFQVMDLLRCKCTGPKSQIQRIYKQILEQQDYFQLIRVKNKLNQKTRDILINLKLKNSFLICQVQLSMGADQQQINDHFCHYLYELQRSQFSILNQCANQIVNLDPRVKYFTQQKQVSWDYRYQLIQKIHQNINIIENQIMCTLGHKQNKMQFIKNIKPFICGLCREYITTFSYYLQYVNCNICYICICPSCIMQFAKNKNSKIFIYNYMKRYFSVQYNQYMVFFDSQPKYFKFCKTQQFESTIKQVLKFEKYIFYLRIDSQGMKVNILKMHKNQIINSFHTVKQIKKDTVKNSKYVFNVLMVPLNPITTSKLNELKIYNKYYYCKSMIDIQQILRKYKKDQVVALIKYDQKKLFIIDWIQTDEQIDQFNYNFELEHTIQVINKSKTMNIDLSSKNLKNLQILDKIKQKKSVRILNLWQNQIQNLSNLQQFSGLKQLILRKNKIKDLSQIVHLKHLQTLNIRNNLLQGQLPQFNLDNIQVLDITVNKFTNVDLLDRFPKSKLKFLFLTDNKIQNFPILQFQYLELLHFSCNQIHNINNLSRSKLPNLKQILGFSNKIQGPLPKLFFENLVSLNLHLNQITDINELKNSKLTKLESINLSSNKISGEFPQIDFPQIREMFLMDNQLNHIENISKLSASKLQIIDLSNNKVEGSLPVLNLVSLEILNMQNNQLRLIENLQKSQLPHLKELNLQKNKIQGEFPMIKFLSIIEINLSFNLIENLVQLTNCKVPSLQILNISNNKVKSKVPVINFKKLKKLILTNNEIFEIDCILQLHLIQNIQIIELSNNLVHKNMELKKYMQKNPNIKKILRFQSKIQT